MIDFRFHLVSLVAVLLALGVGILGGSFFVPEIVQRTLENQVDYFTERNADLRRDVDLLQDDVAAIAEFVEQTEEPLVRDALAQREVVLLDLEGADEGLVDGLQEGIETAGGSIVGRLTITTRMALTDPDARTELTSLLGGASGESEELQDDIGELLGQRIAAATEPSPAATPRVREQALNDLRDLLQVLADADFLRTLPDVDELELPPGALYLVVGGGEERVWDPSEFVTAVAGELAGSGSPVVTAEPTASAWGLVGAVRDDGITSATVSTVDGAEAVTGRVAVTLALAEAARGGQGHYGREPGAEALVPQPTPSG